MNFKQFINTIFGFLKSKKDESNDKDSNVNIVGTVDNSYIINQLIKIESTICEQAEIAQNKFSSDPIQLLKIIRTQHIEVENLLKTYNVECKRSNPDTPFDPEIQEASIFYIDTNDPAKEGKVAYSICPSFWVEGKLLKCESVKLYNYKSE